MKRRHGQTITWILFLIGASLFALLLYWAGPRNLVTHLKAAGPYLFLVVLFYGLAQMSYTQAWRVLLGEYRHKIPFWKLFGVYLAGDSINYLIPSGNLAGEPIKAQLLRHDLGVLRGLTSVTINKLSETVSMVIFLLVGVSWALWNLSFPATLRWATLLVLTGTTVAIAFFFWRQKKGIFDPVFRFLAKRGVKGPRFEGWHQAAKELDVQISAFHTMGGQGLGTSLFFNLLGWFGGVLEAYWLLRLLDLPASLSTAFIFESLALIVQNATFFIPGRLGGSDGGRVIIFTLLGFAATKGFSFSVMRRCRELFWVAIGLLFLLRLRPKTSITDTSQ